MKLNRYRVVRGRSKTTIPSSVATAIVRLDINASASMSLLTSGAAICSQLQVPITFMADRRDSDYVPGPDAHISRTNRPQVDLAWSGTLPRSPGRRGR